MKFSVVFYAIKINSTSGLVYKTVFLVFSFHFFVFAGWRSWRGRVLRVILEFMAGESEIRLSSRSIRPFFPSGKQRLILGFLGDALAKYQPWTWNAAAARDSMCDARWACAARVSPNSIPKTYIIFSNSDRSPVFYRPKLFSFDLNIVSGRNIQWNTF